MVNEGEDHAPVPPRRGSGPLCAPRLRTRRRSNRRDKPDTTGRPAQEAEGSAPRDVAEAAAAGIDESSIRTHLARLTGASPAPLDGREVTISERGTESGGSCRRVRMVLLRGDGNSRAHPRVQIWWPARVQRGGDPARDRRRETLWVTLISTPCTTPGPTTTPASLTSILLTAKALEEIGPEHTVHFVAYDLEGWPLREHTHHVENTVKGVVGGKGSAPSSGPSRAT